MVIIRTQAMKDMSDDEIEKKLKDLKLELSKEKSKIKVGGVPENPGKVRELKRTIARILTLKGDRAKKQKEGK